MIAMAVALMSALQVNAQTARVADSELHGAWLMESMQFEGEKKIVCGKERGYSQFKYYGPDGEYACAELVMGKDGKCSVLPHEYGTYTFRNGVYTEMGRTTKPGDLVLTDKTTFTGRWKTRHDIWKKQVSMPQKLVRYIVDCCKAKQMPADMQQLMRQNVFK